MVDEVSSCQITVQRAYKYLTTAIKMHDMCLSAIADPLEHFM